MADLSTVDDVIETLGRPLTSEEFGQTQRKIRRASRIIRERWADVDDRIASGVLDALDVSDVVAAMVARSLQRPTDGIESLQQTAGPFGHNVRYTNPDGNLYLTAEEVRLFEPAGKKRAFAVDLWQR